MQRLVKYLLSITVALAAALWTAAALAEFHTYQIEEIFSNADGTVQYVVMHESQGMSAEYFWAGNKFISSHAGDASKVFTFPNNLPIGMTCNPYTGCAKASPPTSTANTRVLIATQGYADLQIVTPDFVIPNGFLSTAGGTINYAGVDQVTYGALPTDGVTAINRSGAMIPNVATNFIGQSGSSPPVSVNYQGLWYKSPAESESGWGVNFAHQGNTIFASWFTYDLNGKGWWLVMSANQTTPGVFSGTLLQVTGPAFDAVPFPPIGSPGGATATSVGTGTIAFTDANNGVFQYTVNGVSQSKAITRQAFATLPTCAFGTQTNLALASNYQDLWWAAPAGSEAGWGINFAHEGDTIFASWFTYDHDHSPMWLVATAPKTAPGVYAGTLLRTTGPPFNAVPFAPVGAPGGTMATAVGTMQLTFTDGNNATFAYTVNGTSQTKAITREVFQPPGTTCQ